MRGWYLLSVVCYWIAMAVLLVLIVWLVVIMIQERSR